MLRIGFIGLGLMGGHMSANLLKGDHVVTGFDVSASALEDFKSRGGRPAASATSAVQDADLVITMLPNGSIVEHVLFGDGGSAGFMKPDCLYVDMSTIAPDTSDQIRARLNAMGIAMVDAGRTATEARTGELLIMMGGRADDLEKARPAFEKMGSTLIDCGGPGKGIRMKLTNNYMTTVLNVLTAEALTLAAKSGIDLAIALEVLRGTAAGRGHINTTYPSKVLKGDVTPSFMLSLASKDLGLALEFAAASNIPCTTGAGARQMYTIAKTQGRGGQDWTAMLQTIDQLSTAQ